MISDERYGYQAFGSEVSSSTASTKPYRYGGQYGYRWEATNRLYVRGRHYGPLTGRWWSATPLPQQLMGEAPYSYVNNTPVNLMDLDGLAPKKKGGSKKKEGRKASGSGHPSAKDIANAHDMSSPYAYPAPSSQGAQMSEWNQTLPETQRLVQHCLRKAGAVPVYYDAQGWHRLDDNELDKYSKTPIKYHYVITQAIGTDPDSGGTHYADFACYDDKNNPHYYSAVLDISIDPREKLGPIVGQSTTAQDAALEYLMRALRGCGIPAWHREWAKGYKKEQENEIHLIDPNAPFMKPSLQGQIDQTITGAGNRGYMQLGQGAHYHAKNQTDPTSNDFDNFRRLVAQGKEKCACGDLRPVGQGPIFRSVLRISRTDASRKPLGKLARELHTARQSESSRNITILICVR